MKIRFSEGAQSLIVVMLLLVTTLSVLSVASVSAVTDGDYTYTVSGGKATITDYTGTGGGVNIPSTLGGNPTVGIGANAFKASAVTSVVIPDSVTTIGNYAFDRCAALASITIGNGVTSIGTSAFYFDNSLTSVTIPNSVTIIGTTAFNHCARIASLTIGSGVTTIGNYAFADCYSLTSVNIPASVTSVGSYTFSGCPALTVINVDAANPNYASNDGVLYSKNNLTLIQFPCGKAGTFNLPSTVTSVGYAFAFCVGLTAINVDPSNPNYASHDGVLFSKDNNTLIQYPLAKTGDYAIPETTLTINAFAFFHCNSLTALTFPTNTTTIGVDAFKNCTYLSSVTFLGNVTYLAALSFANCSALSSISFYGTVAPVYVSPDFSSGGHAGLVGHALATSNFPAPGIQWNGLLMGSRLSATPAVPGAPTGLTAVTKAGSVLLNWTAPADIGSGVSNYLIFRGTSTGGEGTTPIARVLGTSYTDSSVTAGTPYYYFVKANNTVGVGPASGEVHSSATAATAPSAPQNFQATSGTNQVTLQWTAPSDNGGSSILTYDIYRSDSGGAYSKIGSVQPSTLSYVDSITSDGKAHSYYVVATNSVGKGTTSSVQSVGDTDSGGSSGNGLIIVIIGIIAAVVVVLLAFMFLKRRK